MTSQHYDRIADLYDQFVQTDYDVAFFVQETRQRTGEVLELMAGTGRLTLPLVQAGATVTAVDFSGPMLAVLQEKLAAQGLQATVHQMDVRDLNIGRTFETIVLPFQAFPEITTRDDQRRALQAIHRHLASDGVFICTLHNPPVRLKSVNGQLQLVARQVLDDGGLLLVWLLQMHDAVANVVEVLEFFEQYDAAGLMTHKRYSSVQFHLLAEADFRQLLAETGFEAVQVYGDYQHTPFDADHSPFMIWVLRRA